MCGIAGSISLSRSGSLSVAGVKRMTDAIAHRGPDGEGHWVDDERNVALGHRRLSIIDLSDAGSQPMHYLDRYVIIFNGEIYNYVELKELCVKQGYSFRSTSDTEVIMALYDWMGPKCLQQMDGMFAIALWDRRNGELFCARDRFGEKPFFFAIDGSDTFHFASEMKALWATGLAHRPDPSMVYNYLTQSFTEHPTDRTATFFSNISKLAPAHYMQLKPGVRAITQVRYWDINRAGRNTDISPEEAKLKLRELFFTSVQRRLRSDVPVGSSLSGGLDSSLVVCAIDTINHDRSIVQKTFSAQFPGSPKDESRYQKIIVDHCRTEAHYVQPTAEMMMDHVATVIRHQEEPFGSASICAQYEVFKLAKENGVTVMLDGQGADEVFAGYHHFYDAFLNGLRRSDATRYRTEKQAYRELHADNDINRQTGLRAMMKKLLPVGVVDVLRNKRSGMLPLRSEFVTQGGALLTRERSFPGLQDALYYETMQLGLETLLRYADRNSMANSREVRLPFLSHELVEFLFTLPDEFKIRDGWTKWIMRKGFDDIVPKEVIWRKDKIGYEPPQAQWMKQDVFRKQIVRSAEQLCDARILSTSNIDLNDPFFPWRVFMTAQTLQNA